MPKRLKNLLVLFQTLLKLPFRPRLFKIQIPPQRVLIVQSAKLGDMVCTTPIFRAIRSSFPNCQLTVAGDRINKDLLEHNADVDAYIVLGQDFAANVKNIKAANFDFAAIATPNFLLLAALINSDIPSIVAPEIINGRSPHATKLYNVLSKFVIRQPHAFGAYAPREYLRLLEPLGIRSDDTKKHVAWSQAAQAKVDNLIAQIPKTYNYLIGISAGAGNKEKQWDPKNFATVANYLIENHQAHIVLIGGKTDIAESNAMLAAIKNPTHITDTTNSISIDELKALISGFDLFISVNTGPLYIAEALDIPTVDLVGPVSEFDQPPSGKIHKVVVPHGRVKPIIFVMDTRGHDIREAQRIAQSTRIEDVIRAADEAISQLE